ncbi:hypothetical protein C8R46DRAFT_1286471 [Mycena filopes]|nr:hypothetical protein C8R46DRAFT_1286471 [Mycena filopes]
MAATTPLNLLLNIQYLLTKPLHKLLSPSPTCPLCGFFSVVRIQLLTRNPGSRYIAQVLHDCSRVFPSNASILVKSELLEKVPRPSGPHLLLTPPSDNESVGLRHQVNFKTHRLPLLTTTNAPRQDPPKRRSKRGKENLRKHPNVPPAIKHSSRAQTKEPKRIKRADFVKAVEDLKRSKIASSVKVTALARHPEDSAQLAAARTCPSQGPPPLAPYPSSVSLRRRPQFSHPPHIRPALEERLRCAVAEKCASAPVAASAQDPVPATLLPGDENATFVVDNDDEDEVGVALPPSLSSGSSSSISFILDAFEDGLGPGSGERMRAEAIGSSDRSTTPATATAWTATTSRSTATSSLSWNGRPTDDAVWTAACNILWSLEESTYLTRQFLATRSTSSLSYGHSLWNPAAHHQLQTHPLLAPKPPKARQKRSLRVAPPVNPIKRAKKHRKIGGKR